MNLPWPDAWSGSTPVCLMIMADEVTIIDLDETNWMQTYAWIFDTPAEWHLLRKSNKQAVLSMHVLEGNQPYYVARVIGSITGPHAGLSTRAYGIGKKAKRIAGKGEKKRWAWNQDNLWWLPWGQVCGGTDVELFAISGLAKGFSGG